MRLLLTAVPALLARNQPLCDALACQFRVTPWDVGISTLKSDRYFSIAEAAQVDFMIRAGLLGYFWRENIRWVNVAQASRFLRPLRLFQGFTVLTRISCVDERHAYLSHTFMAGGQVHAEVFVKVKFKSGRLTVPPQRFWPHAPEVRTSAVNSLDALG